MPSTARYGLFHMDSLLCLVAVRGRFLSVKIIRLKDLISAFHNGVTNATSALKHTCLRGDLNSFVYLPKNGVLLDNSDPDRRGGGGRGRVANLPAKHTQFNNRRQFSE